MPIHHQLPENVEDRAAFVVGREARCYHALRMKAHGWAAWINATPRNPLRRLLLDVPRVTALCLPNHIAFAEIFLCATMDCSVCAVLDPYGRRGNCAMFRRGFSRTG